MLAHCVPPAELQSLINRVCIWLSPRQPVPKGSSGSPLHRYAFPKSDFLCDIFCSASSLLDADVSHRISEAS